MKWTIDQNHACWMYFALSLGNICSVTLVLMRRLCSMCIMSSDLILYLCIQVKEEKIGGVVRMRMNQRKGSWCLKRMDKVCCNTLPFNKHSAFPWNAFSLIICCFLEYAQVIKMLGNGRLEAMCFDGVKRLCHIRGKLRKKVRFTFQAKCRFSVFITLWMSLTRLIIKFRPISQYCLIKLNNWCN